MAPTRTLLLLFLTLSSSALAEGDYVHVANEVAVEPVGGAVQGRSTLTLEAGVSAPGEVALVLDRGLSVAAAAAPGRTVTIKQTPYKQYNYVQLGFSPPLQATSTVLFTYGGVLLCQREGNSSACDLGAPGRIARFRTAALLPFFVESGGPDVLTQELTLYTPKGSDLLVTADPVSRAETGTHLITRWKLDKPLPNSLSVYVGALASVPLTSGPTRVTAWHAPGDDAWATKLSVWVPPILSFLERYTGQPLPFQNVSLLKLPSYLGETGHAGNAHVCLSDWHGSASDPLFEEEWAHELSHFFFGIAIAPTDFARERLLTEGLAVLTELDYAFDRFHPAEDRDLFLSRRTREAELLLRYPIDTRPLPPLVAAPGQALPSPGVPWWTWTYAKAPAALDFIRVVIGDEAFGRGLRGYIARCLYEKCSVTEFRQELEKASNRSLATLFDEWIYRAGYPELTVGFTTRSLGDGAEEVAVTLKQKTDLSVPLELWVEGVDGTRTRHPVLLSGRELTLRLTSAGPVASVRPNPRQDALLWSRSAIRGDVNFDGAVDGKDLLHCAFRYGKEVKATFQIGETLPGVDLDFDPRCDADADGHIGEADLASLSITFPTSRQP